MAPPRRASQRSRRAAPEPDNQRRQAQGPNKRPAEEAKANKAIADAPAAALLVRAATSSADCSRPQGHAAHSTPAASAGQGRAVAVRLMTAAPAPAVAVEAGELKISVRVVGAVDLADAVGTRPHRPIQTGCLPCHSKYRPSASVQQGPQWPQRRRPLA